MKIAAPQSITIENFRSIKKQTFAFPSPDGLYFLGGENRAEPTLDANGAGKSSFWDAMHWCLFGTSGAGVKVSELMTWGVVDSLTSVSLTLKVGDYDYVIQRTGPPLRLYIDGTLSEQSQLENLIGLNKKRFQNSVIFTQGQQLFPDFSIPDRGALLEDVLNLSFWSRCGDITTQLITQFEKGINEYTKQLEYANGQLSGLPSLLKLNSDLVMWDADRTGRILKLKTLESSFASDRAQTIATLQQQDNEYKKDLQTKCEASIVEFEQIRTTLLNESQLEGVKATEQKWRTDTENINEAKRKFESRVGMLESERISYQNRACPMCNQQLHPEIVAKRLGEVQTELSEIVVKLQNLAVSAKHATEQLAIASQVVMQELRVEIKREERQKTIDKLTTEIQRMLDNLDAETPASVAIKNLESSGNPYTQQIANTYAEQNPWTNEIQRVTIERATIDDKIKLLTAQRDETTRLLDEYTYWKNGFKRLRVFMIHRVLAALEIECNAAANTLGLVGWKIGLVSQTETKSETIKLGVQIQVSSPGSKIPVSWESWSGGEAQRLKLAIAIGVSSLIQRASGVSWALEVYDEPTQHLAASGVEKLMESLDYRSTTTNKRIFVVDHTALTYSNFRGIYRAVKTANEGTTII